MTDILVAKEMVEQEIDKKEKKFWSPGPDEIF